MKRTFSKCLLVGGLLVLAAPATGVAQKAQKEKGSKEVQQIIITRSGGNEEKTVVEIKGDRVLVNGKDVKELKNEKVRVDVNRLKDVDALVAPRGPVGARGSMALGTPPRVFNFEGNEDGMHFFEEDTTRAMLGVLTSEDEKGARINDVTKESGAEKAGLKKGDIITRIDDAKIENAADVSEQVRKHKPGDKVTVTVLRDGKEQKMVAELSKWKGIKVNAPNFRVMIPNEVTPFGPNQRFDFKDFDLEWNGGGRPRLGISVQDSEDGKGVTIQEVEEESNAAKAGLKKGDVITHFNDSQINDVTDLRRELAENRDKLSAKFRLLRNGKEQTIDVKLPRKLKTADL